MSQTARPYRSVLYIPGSNPRAMEKAKTLPVDAIIFDLEDAVALDEKINARDLLASTLAAGGYGARTVLVRINGLETKWGAGDVAAFVGADVDGIVLPKVNSAADVELLAQAIPDVSIWAMMESAQGILNAAEIAAHPRLDGFILGTNDLAKELTSRARPDREPLLTSLQVCLLAARAHGIICVDGVYNAFKDEPGLLLECEQGRDMGFDGKTLIHPAQVSIANQVFAPSQADIDLAKRQISAFQTASAAGQGVAVVDGQIVENLHIEVARVMLAKVAAIKDLEN